MFLSGVQNMRDQRMFKKTLSIVLTITFTFSSLGPVSQAHADVLNLPIPGTMVSLSPVYEPVMIKGLTVHKDNPFLFDFIVDVGQDWGHVPDAEGGRYVSPQDALKKEGEKLIKYFFASLAIPEKDLWVNLSPYEKDRTIPEELSKTDMGRDLLAQDYILKQITASLIYPEKALGKTFWDKVYTKAQQLYGTTEIPVNTFNKVWIMADKAEVFEHNQTAFVTDSHLKVMLEEDYLALSKNQKGLSSPKSSIGDPEHKASSSGFPTKAFGNDSHAMASDIVRQIILPELEKEVNTGKNFANLRQIFNSLILASWYKKNLKEALLNQVYSNQSKVKGLEYIPLTPTRGHVQSDSTKNVSPGTLPTSQALNAKASEGNPPNDIEAIYDQYLAAYKKGVFNYIKEDVDPSTGSGQVSRTIPRKYFSGGMQITPRDVALTSDPQKLAHAFRDNASIVDITAGLDLNKVSVAPDRAMTVAGKAESDKAMIGYSEITEIGVTIRRLELKRNRGGQLTDDDRIKLSEMRSAVVKEVERLNGLEAEVKDGPQKRGPALLDDVGEPVYMLPLLLRRIGRLISDYREDEDRAMTTEPASAQTKVFSGVWSMEIALLRGTIGPEDRIIKITFPGGDSQNTNLRVGETVGEIVAQVHGRNYDLARHISLAEHIEVVHDRAMAGGTVEILGPDQLTALLKGEWKALNYLEGLTPQGGKFFLYKIYVTGNTSNIGSRYTLYIREQGTFTPEEVQGTTDIARMFEQFKMFMDQRVLSPDSQERLRRIEAAVQRTTRAAMAATQKPNAPDQVMTAMAPKRVVLLGPPGAGKGTLALRMKEMMGVPHISTGDMLRAERENDSPLGREIKDIMDRGDLVSDEVMTRLVREKVLHDPALANGFILDGYPRTSQQAKDLDGMLAEAGIHLDFVLYVNTSPEAVVDRLQGRAILENRSDDNEQAVRNRMKVYEANTRPIIDYYASRHALKEMDGNGTREEVVRGWEAIFDQYSSGVPDRAMVIGQIRIRVPQYEEQVRKKITLTQADLNWFAAAQADLGRELTDLKRLRKQNERVDSLRNHYTTRIDEIEVWRSRIATLLATAPTAQAKISTPVPGAVRTDRAMASFSDDSSAAREKWAVGERRRLLKERLTRGLESIADHPADHEGHIAATFNEVVVYKTADPQLIIDDEHVIRKLFKVSGISHYLKELIAHEVFSRKALDVVQREMDNRITWSARVLLRHIGDTLEPDELNGIATSFDEIILEKAGSADMKIDDADIIRGLFKFTRPADPQQPVTPEAIFMMTHLAELVSEGVFAAEALRKRAVLGQDYIDFYARTPQAKGLLAALQRSADQAMAAGAPTKMSLRDLSDADLRGKTVAVRVGYDVPIKDGKVTDDTRLRESLSTVQYLMEHGARVVLMSHLGRPQQAIKKLIGDGMSPAKAREQVERDLSLAPVAKRLQELLGENKVDFYPSVRTMAEVRVMPGNVVLLENLRFNPGEEKNDPAFAADLFHGADIFVLDGMSVAHRAHASVVGAPTSIARVMGSLVEKESEILRQVKGTAKLAVMGGAKVADKITVIEAFLDADRGRRVLIGGAMANAFLAAQGKSIGESIGGDPESVGIADKMLKKYGDRIGLPVDVVFVDNFKDPTRAWDTTTALHIPEGSVIVDIGPKTAERYAQEIKRSPSTFWNGPMGAFDVPSVSKYASNGSRTIAKAVAAAGGVVGGGQSVEAFNKLLTADERAASQAGILTGGGASLEFLEGKNLPGITALSDKADAAMVGKPRTLDGMTDIEVERMVVRIKRSMRFIEERMKSADSILQRYSTTKSRLTLQSTRSLQEARTILEYYLDIWKMGLEKLETVITGSSPKDYQTIAPGLRADIRQAGSLIKRIEALLPRESATAPDRAMINEQRGSMRTRAGLLIRAVARSVRGTIEKTQDPMKPLRTALEQVDRYKRKDDLTSDDIKALTALSNFLSTWLKRSSWAPMSEPYYMTILRAGTDVERLIEASERFGPTIQAMAVAKGKSYNIVPPEWEEYFGRWARLDQDRRFTSGKTIDGNVNIVYRHTIYSTTADRFLAFSAHFFITREPEDGELALAMLEHLKENMLQESRYDAQHSNMRPLDSAIVPDRAMAGQSIDDLNRKLENASLRINGRRIILLQEGEDRTERPRGKPALIFLNIMELYQSQGILGVVRKIHNKYPAFNIDQAVRLLMPLNEWEMQTLSSSQDPWEKQVFTGLQKEVQKQEGMAEQRRAMERRKQEMAIKIGRIRIFFPSIDFDDQSIYLNNVHERISLDSIQGGSLEEVMDSFLRLAHREDFGIDRGSTRFLFDLDKRDPERNDAMRRMLTNLRIEGHRNDFVVYFVESPVLYIEDFYPTMQILRDSIQHQDFIKIGINPDQIRSMEEINRIVEIVTGKELSRKNREDDYGDVAPDRAMMTMDDFVGSLIGSRWDHVLKRTDARGSQEERIPVTVRQEGTMLVVDGRKIVIGRDPKKLLDRFEKALSSSQANGHYSMAESTLANLRLLNLQADRAAEPTTAPDRAMTAGGILETMERDTLPRIQAIVDTMPNEIRTRLQEEIIRIRYWAQNIRTRIASDKAEAEKAGPEVGELWSRLENVRAEISDMAMTAAKGGIDLNAGNMKWSIRKDGTGVEMNIDPAMIERIKREGIESLTPVIFRITPVVSIWPLMGLALNQTKHFVVGSGQP